MKVEHDLLCNECLSHAGGTVAAAAAPPAQPKPTDRAAGGCLPEFLLSRTESECATLLLSQQFTDLSLLLCSIYTIIIFTYTSVIALAKPF